jgi:hypothetical protein
MKPDGINRRVAPAGDRVEAAHVEPDPEVEAAEAQEPEPAGWT